MRHALRASIFVTLAACGASSHGPFTWVDDYAPAKAPAATGYMIGIGDALGVQLAGDANKDFGTTETVRPDGKISMPLLGDLTVVDKSPATVGQEIERALKDRNLVNDPHVSIHVNSMKPLSISVLGKVGRPGAFVMEPGSTIAQAIASAGGPTEFAHRDQIYIQRVNVPNRLRVTFDQVTGGSGVASQFKLKTGDVIVIY
jgi:polysaccharide export outer membrane protein